MAARAILAMTASLALAACAEREPAPLAGEMQLNSLFQADFELTDMTGQPATDERFEGQPMLVYFGFTSCPDVCPAAMSVLSASLDALGEDAEAIQPLFITVDPERDTAERLSRYLAFDDRVLGLTGDQAAIDAARDGLKVFAAKVPLPDSAMGYTMDHQSLFYLVDAEGNAVLALDDGMTPEDIAAVISRYL